MGITKNHIHTQDQINIARLFKALGHPARIAIIDTLLEHDNLNCKGLGTYIQLAQSTISAHIKELHGVGILGVKVIASSAYYVVDKAMPEKITGYLEKVFQQIDKKIKHEGALVYFKSIPIIVSAKISASP